MILSDATTKNVRKYPDVFNICDFCAFCERLIISASIFLCFLCFLCDLFSREEGGREIALASVGQENKYVLAGKLRT